MAQLKPSTTVVSRDNKASSYTYALGSLTRIDYSDGYYKEFTYNLDGTLNTIDVNGEYTKTLVWDLGILKSIGVS